MSSWTSCVKSFALSVTVYTRLVRLKLVTFFGEHISFLHIDLYQSLF